jgi:ABC-type polysaccharide/polyol phosphate export permease
LSTYTSTYTSGTKGIVEAVSSSLVALYRRRWLAMYFMQRELSSTYRKSHLGFLWALLSPLLMIVLLTIVFSSSIGIRVRDVLGDPGLNYGLFLYCGLLPFMAFSEILTKSTNSIRSNAALVQKVVFPLEIFPMTRAITIQIEKVFGVGMLILVIYFMEGRLNWTVLLLPLLLAIQMVFNLGLGYLFAVIGTYLPDVRETLRAFMRVTFFATPIVWSPDLLLETHPNLRFLLDYNPLAFLVEAYRNLVLEGTLPNPLTTLWFSIFAVALCACGFAIFVRTKQKFADLV